MTVIRHGLSIGIERKDENLYLYFKAIGRLTHADYEVITPMIDKALEAVKDPHVKVLFDASELEGWELRAAWDDFKIGLRHGNSFDKVAIVGGKKWMEVAAKIGSWFVGGEVRCFNEYADALAWLSAE